MKFQSGRLGAGRPGWRPQAEQLIKLDMRELRRLGAFEVPATGWVRIAGPIFDFDFDGRQFTVNFDAGQERARATVEIERTECRFGGSRPWFVCEKCRRRVLVVYWWRRTFECRKCADVAYRSQSLNPTSRSWRRQRQIEARLGPRAARPVGMHFTTYLALIRQIAACGNRRDKALVAWGRKMFPHLRLRRR